MYQLDGIINNEVGGKSRHTINRFLLYTAFHHLSVVEMLLKAS